MASLTWSQILSETEKQRFRLTIFLCVQLSIFSYPFVLTHVLGAQKSCLMVVVLFNTHVLVEK